MCLHIHLFCMYKPTVSFTLASIFQLKFHGWLGPKPSPRNSFSSNGIRPYFLPPHTLFRERLVQCVQWWCYIHFSRSHLKPRWQPQKMEQQTKREKKPKHSYLKKVISLPNKTRLLAQKINITWVARTSPKMFHQHPTRLKIKRCTFFYPYHVCISLNKDVTWMPHYHKSPWE